MALFCISLTGCFANNNNDLISKQNSILGLKDNISDKSDLITKTNSFYASGAELLSMTMVSINQKYEIECLRKNNGKYYCVFEDDNNGLLYLLFDKDDKIYVVSDFWHIDKKIYKNNFSAFKKGISKLSDVRKIDKYGDETLSQDTGRLPFSTHKTVDGYYITITYDSDNTIIDILYQKDKSRINYFVFKNDFI